MSNLYGADLIKHYKNIYDLSSNQFAALERDSLTNISSFIDQKQLIFEHIKSSNSQIVQEELPEEIRQVLRKILSDIIELEEKSRKIVEQSGAQLREKLLVFRQTESLRQVYEAPLSSGAIVNQSK